MQISFSLSLLLLIGFQLQAQLKEQPLAGFKAMVIHDSSRNFYSGSDRFEPRPIVAFVWYPATQNKDFQLMRVKEIVNHHSLSAFGPEVVANEEKIFKQVATNYPLRGGHNADDLFNGAMNMVTTSVENARPSKGKHPFVIFGNGMNASGYLFFRQCEWLARHGYVSIVVASRFQYRDSLPTFNPAGIDAQWRDAFKALEVIRKEYFVDGETGGIAAWSVGGVSMSILQSKLPQLKSFFSLDAGIAYEYGKELLSSFNFGKGMANIPLYELRGDISNQVPRSRHYFDSIATANRCMLTISNLDHYHFTSIANLFQQLSANDPQKIAAFEFLNQLMLMFFDATIKKYQLSEKKLLEFSSNKKNVAKKECLDN